MSTDSTTCNSRCCDLPSVGVSSFSGLPLCQQHLDRDRQKAESRKAEFLASLRVLRDSGDRPALRMEMQMLQVEIQEVTDMFDEVQEKLQQWNNRTLTKLQSMHDSVARRLRDAAEAEDCIKEISTTSDEGEKRKMMEIIEGIESWIDEAHDRCARFERVRSEQGHQSCEPGKDANVRCVGDLAGGVQQLHFIIDRHMTDVMQQCWLHDGEVAAEKPPVCRFVGSVDCLENEPRRLASCSNTSGFVGDASGRVVREDPGVQGCMPLPQPCVFVAFHHNTANHLLVTSLTGDVRLRVKSNLDWSEPINGLHCDSRRQLLHVAQQDAVTVANLSGQVTRVINARSLGQTIGDVADVDGNSDKVFLLDNRKRRVLLIGKDTWELQSVIDVGFLSPNGETLAQLAVHGRNVFLTDSDGGQVHKVCSISGQLIVSYPTQRTGEAKFRRPWQVVLDSRGLIFVLHLNGEKRETLSRARSSNKFVKVLARDGEILQILQGSSAENFSSPAGLVCVRKPGGAVLVVADFASKMLHAFELM